jgi:hypothetical protein
MTYTPNVPEMLVTDQLDVPNIRDVFLVEFSDSTPSPFTHGNVQLNLKKNETTQAEVLEKFGPPNIATIDASGNEITLNQGKTMVCVLLNDMEKKLNIYATEDEFTPPSAK